MSHGLVSTNGTLLSENVLHCPRRLGNIERQEFLERGLATTSQRIVSRCTPQTKSGNVVVPQTRKTLTSPDGYVVTQCANDMHTGSFLQAVLSLVLD